MSHTECSKQYRLFDHIAGAKRQAGQLSAAGRRCEFGGRVARRPKPAQVQTNL